MFVLQERDLARIHIVSGDDGKEGKIRARIESLQNHQTDVQREKQTVNEYLYSNNESVGRVLAEITRECDKANGELILAPNHATHHYIIGLLIYNLITLGKYYTPCLGMLFCIGMLSFF